MVYNHILLHWQITELNPQPAFVVYWLLVYYVSLQWWYVPKACIPPAFL